MSILPSSIFSFACDLLASTGWTMAAEGLNAGVAEIRENLFAKGAACGRAVFSATKTLKVAGF
jgi:hypothetical protein